MPVLETIRQNVISEFDASYLQTLLAIVSSAFFILALSMYILTGRRIPGPVK